MKNKPKVLLEKQSQDSYLDPYAPIYLLPNGDVQCGDEIYKPSPMSRHQYPFVIDYLKKKHLPFDVSNFRHINLIDIIEDLQNKKKKSISLKKLIEIVAFSNQVADIKEYKIKGIKHIAYKRHWRKYKKLTEEKKYSEANQLREKLKKREEIVHKLINNI